MRLSLLLVLLLPSTPGLAAELKSIDTPLKTGAVAKGDAAVVIGVEGYRPRCHRAARAPTRVATGKAPHSGR